MEKAGQQSRRARRVEVAIPSRIRHGSFKSAAVTIRDLSFWGFKADSSAQVQEGEHVWIDLPNLGLTRARVAWAGDGKFAGAFLKAVDVRKCVIRAPEAG